jgi:hypothetical protein
MDLSHWLQPLFFLIGPFCAAVEALHPTIDFEVLKIDATMMEQYSAIAAGALLTVSEDEKIVVFLLIL